MTELYENESLTEVNDGIKLVQNKKGLTYGTDAYLLSAFIKGKKNGTAAEIGAGSGIISLLLAQREKFKKIFALEVQEYYASLTERNASLNGLDGVVTAVHTDARDFKTECDAVFMTPPYMKAGDGKRTEDDGKSAARHELNGDISELCRAASGMLKFGGDLYVVYRPDRLTDLISALRDSKIEPKNICFVHQSARHAPCLVLISAKKGGKSGVNVMRPLILTDENGSESEDCKFIYDNGIWLKG
jgi:tRNA1(Val) A37 N6-methylase TrmN6